MDITQCVKVQQFLEEKTWENSKEAQEETLGPEAQDETLGQEVQEEILDQKRCIKQFALNADRNAKFLSSQQKASRFTAKNVIGKKELTKQSCFLV